MPIDMNWRDIMPLVLIWCQHMPHNWCPEPLDSGWPLISLYTHHRYNASLLKSVHEVWKRWVFLKMLIQLQKSAGITKNQGNMTLSNEYSKPPIINPKEMKIQELPKNRFFCFCFEKNLDLKNQIKSFYSWLNHTDRRKNQWGRNRSIEIIHQRSKKKKEWKGIKKSCWTYEAPSRKIMYASLEFQKERNRRKGSRKLVWTKNSWKLSTYGERFGHLTSEANR